ncbi:integrase catalytic domain-containing protein [Trichonephila clavipes]|uniref:Integrase catalytic domain-containing protein n=1 Tax=Trichonephila clavipes TaxID=2585209 RepID=A0A8X6RDF8_TRICX|nr:integrase catalytic domain-containing protein [Trichonephila clavipes]
MNYTRNEAGRYVVQMPVKDIQGLGHSKGLAMKRLDQLWRRLSKDKQMENLYREFMQQYLDLGHMEKVEEHFDETTANNICYYLPHHGVFGPDKTTTKLRVVFNGSASTTSGLSLNDLLLKGEVKEGIFEIMTRFRTHKYAFTTDIRMMFRQILIDPAQRDLLKIMWKTGDNEEPVVYRLKTATYGTANAPFLAIRTLKQLAMDEASRFHLASKVALQDVYMDDVVSGAQNLDTARQLQCQLQNMLETCGMKLHKWNSNSKELLNSSTDQEHSFSTNTESAIKTLGISWKPTGDYFMFKVSIPSVASYTKRDVLSVIARLYDPLGLIGPVISKAKIFVQKLWLRKLNREEFLPNAIAPEWLNFVSSLKVLEELKIDRYILTDSYVKLMLLGYADASELAYGAVVYMHSVKEDGTTTTKLISSISRVAPIKVISIPRLELSACLMLAQLVEKVRLFLQVHLAKVILHTDSTIAIA